MMMLFQIAVLLLALYCIVQLGCLISLIITPKDSPRHVLTEGQLPIISVLVAARNEAHQIRLCLESLHQLDYPKENIHILIGNDQSEDDTAFVVESFIKDKPNFFLFNIQSPLGKARGKANVLAQLAHQAKGEFYLITDADIQVNHQWAKELVQYFGNEQMAIVSGTTIIQDKGFMGRMQGMDWLYFMGLLKAFANIGLHATAVGNNMAIRKSAYWSVGGYENLDFSVTEDYKLYKEVRKRGYKTLNLLNTQSLNQSSAIDGFYNLMQQRKRWLMGAKELPLYWWFLFGLFGLFFPAILVVALVHFKLACLFYGIKLVIQTCTIMILQKQLKVKNAATSFAGFELYSTCIGLATQFFFLWPNKLEWKNRKYDVKTNH